jgi:hypothetical protein
MAFSVFSIPRATRREPADVLRSLPEDSDNRFRLSVRSEQRGAGHWYHHIVHQGMTAATSAGSATYFASIEIPAALGPLEVLDPFVMMLAFHQMTFGGVLEVDGPVSRRLIQNIAHVQAQSYNRWPQRYRPFAIESSSVRETPYAQRDGAAGALAITGGLDSTLALYRQTDPAHSRYPLGLAVSVLDYNPHADRVGADFEPRFIAHMERICARRGLDVGFIRTDLWRIPNYVTKTHGAVFGGLLALLAPTYAFGLLASSFANGQVWDYLGVAPEWQWTYGTGGFDLPSDLGVFNRAERVPLLAGYGPQACDDLIVCGTAENLPDNCGRCAKCVRTMLTFEACGLPLPKCFPGTIDPRLIGYGGSVRPEIAYHTEILRLADAYGIDTPNLRILRRRYLRKALKRKILDLVDGLRWN